MIEIKKKYTCSGCHSCFQICPIDAIRMVADDEGFLYPEVDKEKCICCSKCTQVCPEIMPVNKLPVIKTYAAYRRNLKERLASASGGIFAVLAEFVLQKNGIVFGAAFNEKWELEHCAIQSLDELSKLQGSKYLQSTVGTTFSEAEEYLKSGRLVLFSGTPCQIQGLKKYLGKDYSELITVDLICHGVPSPEIWKHYLEEISKGRKLKRFQPRDKSKGINDAPLIFNYSNGDTIVEKYSENQYIKGFIQNLYLRPSCYKCSFKGADRCSDFTLGDFWGIEKTRPEFYDQYGISAVMLHTETAERIFSLIENQLVTLVSEVEQVALENPCLKTSVDESIKRKAFFEMWKQEGVIKTIKRLLHPNFKERIIKKKNQFIAYLWLLKRRLFNSGR